LKRHHSRVKINLWLNQNMKNFKNKIKTINKIVRFNLWTKT
jgi:hypothetical protein